MQWAPAVAHEQFLARGTCRTATRVAPSPRRLRVRLANPTARRDRSVTTTFRWPPQALLLGDRNAVKPRASRNSRKHPRVARPDRPLVEPAGEDIQGRLVDKTELFIDDHEDAVDVDVTEGQGHLEEVLHVLAETSSRRARCLGPVARSHSEATAVSSPMRVTPPPSRYPGGSIAPRIGTPSRLKARPIISWSP